MTYPPIGHPDNEKTKRASVDSVMLAQAFYRDDDEAVQAILKHCDPHSVALNLCGFIYATFRQFDVDTEERLDIWLAETKKQIGEPDA